MKSKKLIAFLLTLSVLLTLSANPTAKAQNNANENILVEKDTVINRDYFAAGGTVSMRGTINGDAYIFGGTVTIDGVINGDLIAAGGTITVGGEVKNDLRIAGGNVAVIGKVNGNILSGSGTLTLAKDAQIGGSVIAGSGVVQINTPINKTVWIGSGQTIVNSNLKGDANIGSEDVILDAGAKIDGNLTYWSDNQVRISDGATVSGIVRRETMQNREDVGRKFLGVAVTFGLFMKVASTLTLIVLGLLALRFFPKKTLEVSKEVERNPLANLGWGLGAALVVGFASLILAISLFGLPFAVVLMVVLALEMYVSGIFVAFWLGRKLFANLDKQARYSWALITGVVLLQILSVLPFIGWLVKIVTVFVGLGALIRIKRTSYTELKAKL